MHSTFFFICGWWKDTELVHAIFAKIATFQRAPMPSYLNFFYTLAILAINRHFPQIRHFHQNRHFPKVPFAISIAFLFIIWRFRRLIAISAIFAIYAIFAKIATFQRAPLPSHLNFVYSLAISSLAKASFSPHSSPLGTFRAEERLRLSDRNSILMTQSMFT